MINEPFFFSKKVLTVWQIASFIKSTNHADEFSIKIFDDLDPQKDAYVTLEEWHGFFSRLQTEAGQESAVDFLVFLEGIASKSKSHEAPKATPDEHPPASSGPLIFSVEEGNDSRRAAVLEAMLEEANKSPAGSPARAHVQDRETSLQSLRELRLTERQDLWSCNQSLALTLEGNIEWVRLRDIYPSYSIVGPSGFDFRDVAQGEVR